MHPKIIPVFLVPQRLKFFAEVKAAVVFFGGCGNWLKKTKLHPWKVWFVFCFTPELTEK